MNTCNGEIIRLKEKKFVFFSFQRMWYHCLHDDKMIRIREDPKECPFCKRPTNLINN